MTTYLSPVMHGTSPNEHRLALAIEHTQNVATNESTVTGTVYIAHTWGTPGSWNLAESRWSARIGGRYRDGATTYDFRNNLYGTKVLYSFTEKFKHDANGDLTIRLEAGFASAGNHIGAANIDVQYTLPRIPPAIAAPGFTSWAQDAAGALVATWSTPAPAPGLVGYRLQLAHDANFTSGVQNVEVGLVNTKTITGLAAGRVYYARVAARGDRLGAWSAARSAMLVLSSGDLDGWQRLGTDPVGVARFTPEGLRRGTYQGKQALHVEAIATRSVTLQATAHGLIRYVSGLTPGKAYRFEMSAALTANATAESYQLITNYSLGDPVTVTTTPASLGVLEFVATAETEPIGLLLAETVTTGATDTLERLALFDIRLWELNTDYGQRLRETVYTSSLTNHLDLACNSVGASWYVAADGVTRFRLPGAALPVSVVFSDTSTPGALHYIDIQAGHDTRSMLNRIEVTNYGVDDERENEENDELIVARETSIETHGERTAKLDINLYDEAPYQDALAQRLEEILDAHDEPELLVSRIVWNAQEDLNAAAQLEVGQRVTVHYRGNAYDSQIVGISHAIQPTRWMVTLDLQKI